MTFPARRPARFASNAAIVACLGGFLSGCSTYYQAKGDFQKATDTAQQSVKTQSDDAQNRAVRSDAITSDDSVYLGNTLIERVTGHELPAGHRHLNLKLTAALPARDALRQICDNIGMGISIEGPDLAATTKASMPASEALGGAGGRGKDKEGGLSATSAQFQPRDAILLRALSVGRYDGDAEKKLDEIARDLDITWEVRNDVIVFSTVESRMFEFGADLNKTTVKNTAKAGTDLTSNGGSGTGSQVSTQANSGLTITHEVTNDTWAELSKALAAMLPPSSGGGYALINTMGRVMIWAPPSVMSRISPQIEALRREVHRQVSVNVRLVALTTDDVDDYGLDLSVAMANPGKDYNISLATPQTAVLSSAAALTATNTGKKGLGGLFSGSSASVQALSQIGHVSQLRNTTVWAHNNEIVTVSKTSQQAYVQSIGAASTGATTGTTAFPTVTPATVSYGYDIYVTPHIIDDRHIKIEYGVNLSTLDALVNYPVFTGYNIQQPTETLNAIPSQTIEMSSGDTVITVGLQIDDTTLNNLGVTQSISLPGETKGEKQTGYIIIIISAAVLDMDAHLPVTKIAGK